MTAKAEQETVIRFAADSDDCCIWTAQPTILHRCKQLGFVPSNERYSEDGKLLSAEFHCTPWRRIIKIRSGAKRQVSPTTLRALKAHSSGSKKAKTV